MFPLPYSYMKYHDSTAYTIHNTLYTLHFTQYIVHLTLYTLHCVLYIVHYTLYTITCSLLIIHSKIYTELNKCKVYREQCTQYIEQCTVRTVHCSLVYSAQGGSSCHHTPHDTEHLAYYCVLQHCTSLNGLYCTAVPLTALHGTILSCSAVYCTVNHYTTLLSAAVNY